MNTNFMRLPAERLEYLYWIEVFPDDCLVLEFFDSMDGFFMSSDLKFWDRPPGFIFGDDLAHALLRPSALHCRMRAVTPRMAAEVLRCCALGIPPQEAWARVGQALRECRLRRLADVLVKTEAGAPVKKVVDWTYPEMAANLTCYSMRDPGSPRGTEEAKQR